MIGVAFAVIFLLGMVAGAEVLVIFQSLRAICKGERHES